MDLLFSTVQTLMHLGYCVWVQARTVDEHTIHITLHYQTGEFKHGVIGEDNVRMFVSPRDACSYLQLVFSSVLDCEVQHA